MSEETADADTGTDQQPSSDSDSAAPDTETSDESPLTIALPDGSESVSDAIIAHREMLSEPRDHGLATEQDITHLSEAVEGLSTDIEGLSQQYEEDRPAITELQNVVEQQQRQIRELQSMVTSLAEILGTETEWQTFDDS
jgi:chromosome segregation ATPase